MVTPDQLADARRHLGQQLATLREAAGLTQLQLAGLAGYTRSTIANVETGRSGQPRDCWVRYDTLLNAGGVLLAGFDHYAGLLNEHRQQAADERERERAAKIDSWRSAHAATDSTADPSGFVAPDGPLVVDSHKFIPTFIGNDNARRLSRDALLVPGRVGWLDCHSAPLPHPEGECRLHVFGCGVAVAHLHERREPDTLTDLATWRYRSYTTDLPWLARHLADLLGPSRASAGEPDYVLSLYWSRHDAWADARLDTALRLICAPSALVDRRNAADPKPLDNQVEQALLGDSFTHPDMSSFGVPGVSIGYAAWSGVAYHPLVPERALTIGDLVECEIIVQMLWCYCDRILRTVEDGQDPSVPTEYGWRFLRAANSRLTAARPQETSQHYLMREAIVNTSGVLGKLRAAQEALRESELTTREVPA